MKFPLRISSVNVQCSSNRAQHFTLKYILLLKKGKFKQILKKETWSKNSAL